MKTHNEIKNGLVEAVAEMFWATKYGDADDMRRVCGMAHASMADALAYIQQLEAERDAAVEDINIARSCRVCKNLNNDPVCSKCSVGGRNFEWRGAQKEE